MAVDRARTSSGRNADKWVKTVYFIDRFLQECLSKYYIEMTKTTKSFKNTNNNCSV